MNRDQDADAKANVLSPMSTRKLVTSAMTQNCETATEEGTKSLTSDLTQHLIYDQNVEIDRPGEKQRNSNWPRTTWHRPSNGTRGGGHPCAWHQNHWPDDRQTFRNDYEKPSSYCTEKWHEIASRGLQRNTEKNFWKFDNLQEVSKLGFSSIHWEATKYVTGNQLHGRWWQRLQFEARRTRVYGAWANFQLLSRSFGVGAGRVQMKNSVATRDRRARASIIKCLDELERISSRGYPAKLTEIRRNIIIQNFSARVINQDLQRTLATSYAGERYPENSPTVERLRYFGKNPQNERTIPRRSGTTTHASQTKAVGSKSSNPFNTWSDASSQHATSKRTHQTCEKSQTILRPSNIVGLSWTFLAKFRLRPTKLVGPDIVLGFPTKCRYSPLISYDLPVTFLFFIHLYGFLVTKFWLKAQPGWGKRISSDET